jgi:hypothetical protein
MKHTLRSVLLAGTVAVSLSSVANAINLTPPPNPGDFIITETPGNPGHYTVTDNSSFWYIDGFMVTYAPGANSPFTTQPHWSASTCFGSCVGNNNAFDYNNSDPINVLTNDIQTHGGSSSLFFFSSFALASDFIIDLTDGVSTASVSGSTAATPLPAALPLMASVLGVGYLLSRRRKLRGAGPGQMPA